LKPSTLRPQALCDQQGEVRYHRTEGGTRLAVKVARVTHEALDQLERQPAMGSPTLGKLLGIPRLRTWRVGQLPMLRCYFERTEHSDVARLLGERQDILAILGDEFGSNEPRRLPRGGTRPLSSARSTAVRLPECP